MKKAFLWILMCVLAVVIGYGLAQAQIWYPANQKTVAWDAVTTMADGTALPTGSTVRYKVYIVSKTDTAKATPTEVGTSTTTSATITFTAEGQYFVGVKAERLISGAVVSESAIAWSDSAAATGTTGTFGVVFYKAPSAPVNLR